MKDVILAILIVLIIGYSSHSAADIVVDGADGFKQKVEMNLYEAQNSSVYLAELIQNINRSSSSITIKPITNDKSTWHSSGKKSRSHTEAQDNMGRGAARNAATNAIIYINTNRITKTHRTYASGTLIHELVHAADLANGKYHGSYPIREKRAVFFQNIWRANKSKELRTDYHGRFETKEYQKALAAGTVRQFVDYYFEHNDTP